MKRLMALMAAFCAAPAFAQTPPPATTTAPAAAVVRGSVSVGAQTFGNTSNSAKPTEYRDLRDSVYMPAITFGVSDPKTGTYVNLSGANVSRDDQAVFVRAGRAGGWNAQVSWAGVPHNFSNKAVTPYIQRTPGVFEVPATVPITFKKLATGAADTSSVLANDGLVAAFQAAFLAPTPLATQTNVGRVAFSSGPGAVTAGLAYDRREKTGQKAGFGPIGDRPPRTLNIQLAEPVDYRTNNVTLAAEHDGGAYQIRGEYLYSDFENKVDTLRWENVYATATPGVDYDVWDRLVAVNGARPLAPDNRYHNATVSGGVDLAADSRLMASFSYGQLDQNATLLPYASHSGAANNVLPRATADASMRTTHFSADYVLNPMAGLHVRAFFRRYGLDNNTPSSQWQYVTSDTTNLNGTVSYANKRVSAPYAWDRQNAGAEATWRLPARSTLTAGYEREAIGREHREADTIESVFRAALRVRPASWMSLKGRYLLSVRTGTEYRNQVTREGYWYTQAEANDNNNPALTFDNHPDMRRYDVSDRQRRQFDLTLNLTPRDVVALSAFVRYRKDDFDSNVQPSQPLLGTGLADASATTPGDQLGLLENARLRYGMDVFLQPHARASFNAFLNLDKGTSFQRSIEFNENNKANPSAIATAELGPWTRKGNQWTADSDDTTWGGGIGATFQLVPDRVLLAADYTLSLASIDLTYAGFGVANFDGTPFPANHQFGFSSPPTIREDLKVLNLRLEVPVRALTFIVGYSYETYALEDWQQGSSAPWVEAVGADTLLRDTSRSFQWGNRLFNLGTYLSPGYNAHVGFVGLRCRF